MVPTSHSSRRTPLFRKRDLTFQESRPWMMEVIGSERNSRLSAITPPSSSYLGEYVDDRYGPSNISCPESRRASSDDDDDDNAVSGTTDFQIPRIPAAIIEKELLLTIYLTIYLYCFFRFPKLIAVRIMQTVPFPSFRLTIWSSRTTSFSIVLFLLYHKKTQCAKRAIIYLVWYLYYFKICVLCVRNILLFTI